MKFPADSAPSAPVSPTRRRSPATRWLRRILVAGAIVAVLVPIGRKTYPVLKAYRGRYNARQAMMFERHGDRAAAAAQLKLALRFAPQDPEVLRTAGHFCAEARLAKGLEYYALLRGTGEATIEDRRAYAELALNLNRVDRAGEELTLLLKEHPQDLESLHLLVRQQRLTRDHDHAIRTARYALSLKPEDERSQLDLGTLLQERYNPPSSRAEGRRLLWGLAVGGAQLRDAATDLLVGNPELTRAERELLLKSLQTRPAGRLRDQLAAADLRLRLEPGRSNALVAETVRLLGPNLPATDLVLLANWAAQHGGSTGVLELLPGSAIGTNRLLLPVRALALVDTARWEELSVILDAAGGPLGPFLTPALQGRLAAAHGKTAEAETHFRSAVEQPAASASQIRYLARETERSGFPLIAVQAWQRLLADPDETINAALQILRIIQPFDDSATVLATLRRLNEFIPGDEFVAGERAWHEAMLRQNLEFARQTVSLLAERHPQESQWRFLGSLVQLRSGHAGDALAQLEPELARWNELTPRQQAVAVIALGENNQREAARGFARKIAPAKLRAAERQMLAPWM
jgi:hypothetical protein